MRTIVSLPNVLMLILAAAGCSSGSSESDTPTPVARELAFGFQPSGILVNGNFHLGPTVQVRDSDGTIVASSSAVIGLHLLPGGGPGALTGPTTSSANHGVAVFPTLSVDQPGTYALVASSPGLDSSVSASFTVQPLPTAAAIEVGSSGGAIRFRSIRNGTTNPAVDTIGSGGKVTWTWLGAGHTVHAADGNFASSSVQNVPSQWVVSFIIPQTYRFDCGIHGSAMSGSIVVQ